MMAGSAAEERIRAKAEAAMRRRWPEARIIHELVLVQGGPRIDLAAVWPDGLAVVEIKSEKDTLDRLETQLRAALGLGCEVWLCVAEKWREPLEGMRMSGDGVWETVPIIHKGRQVGTTSREGKNPGHVREVRDVVVRVETDDGFEPISPYDAFRSGSRHAAVGLLNMLWADELRVFADAGKGRRDDCIAAALEGMTGGQIRRAVCAALRARSFPRADAPVANAVCPVLFRAEAAHG